MKIKNLNFLLLAGALAFQRAEAGFQWIGDWSTDPLGPGSSSFATTADVPGGGAVSGYAHALQQTLGYGSGQFLSGDSSAGTISRRTISLSGTSGNWQLDFHINLDGYAWGARGGGLVKLDVQLIEQHKPPALFESLLDYKREGFGSGNLQTIQEDFTRSIVVPEGRYTLLIAHDLEGSVTAPREFWGSVNFGEAKDQFNLSFTANAIPEPATWTLGAGGAALLVPAWRLYFGASRRRSSAGGIESS